jgi:hypothetical protein
MVFLIPASWAADEIKPFDAKPGLWETTTKMEMPGIPAMPAMPQIPEETLAKMPPAQRAQLEVMIKSRSSAGGPGATTTKVCMTAESLSWAAAFAHNNPSCTTKIVNASSSKQEIHMDCAQGRTRTAGDMVVERIDSEHVKGVMDMKTSMEGAAQTTNMKMTFDTKFVSPECGDVKPFGERK